MRVIIPIFVVGNKRDKIMTLPNISIVENHSGLACRKQYIRFVDNEGKTLGCIQPTSIEFYGLGSTTMFVVEEYKRYRTSVKGCLAEALQVIFPHATISDIDAIIHEMVTKLGKDFDREYWCFPL